MSPSQVRGRVQSHRRTQVLGKGSERFTMGHGLIQGGQRWGQRVGQWLLCKCIKGHELAPAVQVSQV